MTGRQTYLVNHFGCLVILLFHDFYILGSTFSSGVKQLLKEHISVFDGFGAGGHLYATFAFELESHWREAAAVRCQDVKKWVTEGEVGYLPIFGEHLFHLRDSSICVVRQAFSVQSSLIHQQDLDSMPFIVMLT